MNNLSVLYTTTTSSMTGQAHFFSLHWTADCGQKQQRSSSVFTPTSQPSGCTLLSSSTPPPPPSPQPSLPPLHPSRRLLRSNKLKDYVYNPVAYLHVSHKKEGVWGSSVHSGARVWRDLVVSLARWERKRKPKDSKQGIPSRIKSNNVTKIIWDNNRK